MPRLMLDFYLCFVLSAPSIAVDAPPVGGSTVAAAPKNVTDAAALIFSDPIQREAFVAMMSADNTLTAAVLKAADDAAKKAGGDGSDPAADLKAAADAAGWTKNVVDELKKVRSYLDYGLNKSTPPKIAQTDYLDQKSSLYTPVLSYLLRDAKLSLQNPRDLFAKVADPQYSGGPAPSAGPNPCPQATTALGQLQNMPGNGSGGFTGGPCGQDPGTSPNQGPATNDPSNTQTPPSAPAPPPVTDQKTTTGPPPSPPGQDNGGGGGGFGSFFSSLPVNQMLAGVGFGAAVGMLLGFGTPMGMIGGAVIGGLIGAVFGSGLIGKLFGGGGTGGS